MKKLLISTAIALSLISSSYADDGLAGNERGIAIVMLYTAKCGSGVPQGFLSAAEEYAKDHSIQMASKIADITHEVETSSGSFDEWCKYMKPSITRTPR